MNYIFSCILIFICLNYFLDKINTKIDIKKIKENIEVNRKEFKD